MFGAVVGTFIPNWVGFLSFTVALCLLQWLVGLIGITGWVDGRPLAIWAIGVVVGARIADSVVSHWGLYSLGYRPNPGLSSTVLYTIEAVFILIVFHKAYSLDPIAWRCGFLVGAGFLSWCCRRFGSAPPDPVVAARQMGARRTDPGLGAGIAPRENSIAVSIGPIPR